MKIALTMLSDAEYMDFRPLRNWLMDDEILARFANVHVTKLDSAELFTPYPNAYLLQKRDSVLNMHTHMLILHAGDTIIQAPMPGNINDMWLMRDSGPIMPVAPPIFEGIFPLDSTTKSAVVDLSSGESKKDDHVVWEQHLKPEQLKNMAVYDQETGRWTKGAAVAGQDLESLVLFPVGQTFSPSDVCL